MFIANFLVFFYNLLFNLYRFNDLAIKIKPVTPHIEIGIVSMGCFPIYTTLDKYSQYFISFLLYIFTQSLY